MTALRSALVVPVSEASEAVDAWLERTATAKPSAGIPAHITIVFPFVPARSIDKAVISSYPEYPPYEGEFDTIVPHLTAAEGDPAVLDAAEAAIQPFLPVQALAREVTLLEEIEPEFGRWQVRETFRLGA